MAANNKKLHFVTTCCHRISLKIGIQGLLSILNLITISNFQSYYIGIQYGHH